MERDRWRRTHVVRHAHDDSVVQKKKKSLTPHNWESFHSVIVGLYLAFHAEPLFHLFRR